MRRIQELANAPGPAIERFLCRTAFFVPRKVGSTSGDRSEVLAIYHAAIGRPVSESTIPISTADLPDVDGTIEGVFRIGWPVGRRNLTANVNPDDG